MKFSAPNTRDRSFDGEEAVSAVSLAGDELSDRSRSQITRYALYSIKCTLEDERAQCKSEQAATHRELELTPSPSVASICRFPIWSSSPFLFLIPTLQSHTLL